MNIKINIIVHSENAISDATKIKTTLKDENIRGVKVDQPEAPAKKGTLSMSEYLPMIELVIKSGLGVAVVNQIFGLLQNGFFTKNKEIKSNEKIELAKIASAEKLSEQANNLKYIEIQLEHNGKIESFKFSENEKEQALVLNKLIAHVDSK